MVCNISISLIFALFNFFILIIRLHHFTDGLFKKANTKSAPQFNSIEEKFYALAQKYVDSQETNKKLQSNGKDVEKAIVNLTKQRDQIQAEYGKTLLVKTKLESLCRELQRQNKLVKVIYHKFSS